MGVDYQSLKGSLFVRTCLISILEDPWVLGANKGNNGELFITINLIKLNLPYIRLYKICQVFTLGWNDIMLILCFADF